MSSKVTIKTAKFAKMAKQAAINPDCSISFLAILPNLAVQKTKHVADDSVSRPRFSLYWTEVDSADCPRDRLSRLSCLDDPANNKAGIALADH